MRLTYLQEAGALQNTAHLHYYQNIEDLISVSREKTARQPNSEFEAILGRKKYSGILKRRK
jgi:hypothetical protein